MKKLQLQQIIREEVRNAISEIDLIGGDARESDSLYILMDSTFRNLWPDLNTYNPSPKDQKILDAPISADIRKKIEKKKWDSQGNLVITKTTNNSGRSDHHLFDFTRPMKTACIGVITTSTASGDYSTDTMFGMPSVTIHWSNIATEYRGLKYGAFLYDSILMNYGVVESDSILFAGSAAMWKYHIYNRSKAFVGTMTPTEHEWQNTIVPLTKQDLKNNDVLEGLGSFIAFYDKVPKEVSKLIKLTAGTSLSAGTLGVVYVRAKVTSNLSDDEPDLGTWLDLIDTADSIENFINDDDETNIVHSGISNSKHSNWKAVIISFEDAVIVIRDSASGLKSDLI